MGLLAKCKNNAKVERTATGTILKVSADDGLQTQNTGSSHLNVIVDEILLGSKNFNNN